MDWMFVRCLWFTVSDDVEGLGSMLSRWCFDHLLGWYKFCCNVGWFSSWSRMRWAEFLFILSSRWDKVYFVVLIRRYMKKLEVHKQFHGCFGWLFISHDFTHSRLGLIVNALVSPFGLEVACFILWIRFVVILLEIRLIYGVERKS